MTIITMLREAKSGLNAELAVLEDDWVQSYVWERLSDPVKFKVKNHRDQAVFHKVGWSRGNIRMGHAPYRTRLH